MGYTSERNWKIEIKGIFFSCGDNIKEAMEKVMEHIKKIQEVSTMISTPSLFTSLIVNDLKVEEYNNKMTII